MVAHEDGQLAWDYLKDEDHDVKLVITDIEMPNMNGFQLCQKVKQHERLGNLPVIALTSLTSEADVKHGKDVGMDDYQVKPIASRSWQSSIDCCRRSRRNGARRKSKAEANSELVAV